MKPTIGIFGIGYAGGVLTRQLLESGYRVKAIDNFYKCKPESIAQLCSHPSFEFEFGDITNEEDVKKNLRGMDYVVLLSSLVGAPISFRYPKLSYEVTVNGTKNVLKHKSKNVPLFYSSTGSVYGELDQVCTEESPTNPKSPYGIHKLMAEDIVLNDENSYVYRFATAFGLGHTVTRTDLLINDLVLQAYKNKVLVIFQGSFKRTFIHIEDFADSFVHGIEWHEGFKHRLFNVGSENGNYTKSEIAEMIKKKTNCKVFYEDVGQDPDLRNYECDFSKFYSTGWRPSMSVENGIDEILRAAPLLI